MYKGRWREGKRKRGGESLQVVRMRGHVEPSIGEKQKEGKKEKECMEQKRGEGEGRERSRGKRMTEGRKVGRRDDAHAYEE